MPIRRAAAPSVGQASQSRRRASHAARTRRRQPRDAGGRARPGRASALVAPPRARSSCGRSWPDAAARPAGNVRVPWAEATDGHTGLTVTDAVRRARCAGGSDLDDDRDDHRAATVACADPAAHGPAHDLLQLVGVGDAVRPRRPRAPRRSAAAPRRRPRRPRRTPARVSSGPATTLPVTESTTTSTEMKPSVAEDAPVLQRRLGRRRRPRRRRRRRSRTAPRRRPRPAVDEVDDDAVLGEDDVLAGTPVERSRGRRWPGGDATRRAPA